MKALGGLEPPISCLLARRINRYATEPVHSLNEASKTYKGSLVSIIVDKVIVAVFSPKQAYKYNHLTAKKT